MNYNGYAIERIEVCKIIVFGYIQQMSITFALESIYGDSHNNEPSAKGLNKMFLLFHIRGHFLPKWQPILDQLNAYLCLD